MTPPCRLVSRSPSLSLQKIYLGTFGSDRWRDGAARVADSGLPDRFLQCEYARSCRSGRRLDLSTLLSQKWELEHEPCSVTLHCADTNSTARLEDLTARFGQFEIERFYWLFVDQLCQRGCRVFASSAAFGAAFDCFAQLCERWNATKFMNDIRIVSQQCELTSAYDSGAASMTINMKK